MIGDSGLTEKEAQALRAGNWEDIKKYMGPLGTGRKPVPKEQTVGG